MADGRTHALADSGSAMGPIEDHAQSGNRRMPTVNGRRHYDLVYDERPQDAYLATTARLGAQLPRELVEPE